MTPSLTLPTSVYELESSPSSGIMGSLFRMTVDQYERLVESGVLDGQPIELINGLLVAKMGKKPPHVIACEAMRDALLPLIPAGWRLTIEAPVRIPDFDEPEPDLGIVRGSRDQYIDHHPGPAETGAVDRSGGYHARSRPRREAVGLCPWRSARLLDREPG